MVKLLKLRVVPELLYAFQELDVLSGAPNLHRAATQVSQGGSNCDCHFMYASVMGDECEKGESTK